jgi:HEAT repeats
LMVELAQSDESAAVRLTAVTALGARIRDAEVGSLLKGIAQVDPNAAVRNMAWRLMVCLPDIAPDDLPTVPSGEAIPGAAPA